jgi:predicted dehydrogenase
MISWAQNWGMYIMDKIRIGVIGAGNMGIHHIRNYYYHPMAELSAVVDSDTTKLDFVGSQYHIPTFQTVEEILDKVDAVSIVTPTSTHFDLAFRLISHHKHVLLEKPMTSCIDEAKRLISLSEETGSILAIGHIERFNPVICELKHILTDKKPLFIDIHRESPFDKRIFDTDVIGDLMIHDIDLLYYLLGEELHYKSSQGIRVYSTSTDLVNTQLQSESGILVNVTTSRVTEQKIRQWRIVLQDLLIEADLIERKLYITRRTSVSMHSGNQNSGISYKQEQLVEKVLVPTYEPLQAQITNFLHAIHTGQPVRTNGAAGLKALQLIMAIKQAS